MQLRHASQDTKTNEVVVAQGNQWQILLP
jgi:hypothetical protein